MENKIIQLDLLEEKKKISFQIESLKKDLEAVNRLLEKYDNDDSKTLYTDGMIYESKKLSDAISELFDAYPTKEWKSTDVIKNMEVLRDEGKIHTKTKDFATSVRSVIKSMIVKGYVMKIPVMGGMRYKKSTKKAN